jgi:histidyl-tRNA synthetase
MIEVISNKAIAGDARALATIVQIADKLGVFNLQWDVTIDMSGYELIMSRLEEMGYNTGRPSLATE